MRLHLKREVLLAVGEGDMPVDLVLKPTGARVPLNPEEAAVAMLLVDGVPEGEPFLTLIRQHGVAWSIAMLNGFIDRMVDSGLVERLPERSPGLTLAPEPILGDAPEVVEEYEETIIEGVNVLAVRHQDSMDDEETALVSLGQRAAARPPPPAPLPATASPEEEEWLEPTDSWLDASPTPLVAAPAIGVEDRRPPSHPRPDPTPPPTLPPERQGAPQLTPPLVPPPPPWGTIRSRIPRPWRPPCWPRAAPSRPGIR